MATQLRVLWGEDDEPSAVEAEKAAAIAKRPELAWRLREFFVTWFAPKYLRRCSKETTRNYTSSLRYWESITEDWRLVDLAFDREGADGQALDFTEQLSEWGYSRRGIRRGDQIRIGRLAEYPSFTPLTAVTARDHASRVANLFRKAGPEVPGDNRHRYAELLPRAPLVEIISADFDEKEPFSLANARAIAAACGRMNRPYLPDWIGCELWWQVRLCELYYTGLRMGTVVRLDWSHVCDLFGEHPWLKVPRALVKTRKKIDMPLHPQLVELLRKVWSQRPAGWPDESLLPAGCGRRNLLDLHAELQELAGLAEHERQSLHAWRRTHLTQICELGAGRGLELAQVAADHADGRTTAQNYVAVILNHFRLRLPPLFEA